MGFGKTRVALTVLDGFAALSAVGGGIAVASGVDKFPPEWLSGSPFDGYLVPGLILAVAVGGSATIAAVAVVQNLRPGPLLSVAAGAIMIGWMAGEVAILNQNSAATSPRSPTEAVNLVVGVAMVALGAALARRRPPDQNAR